MADVDPAFSLAVPATKDHLSTIRLFGAAAAAHLGAGSDSVEDLRLALSEACAIAMGGDGDGPGRVEVVLSPTRGGVHVEVRGDRVPGSGNGDQAEAGEIGDAEDTSGRDLGMALLQALVRDLSILEGTDGSVRLAFDVTLAADANGEEDTYPSESSPTPGRASDH
jgi:anti-sigma regulatory factor (Ser/Thr protein kinase)